MYLKIHKSYRAVVALADSDLIGKKFEEGNLQLNVTESFYKGEEVTEDQAIHTLEMQTLEDSTFNIVGEESIKTAIKAGIIKENEFSKIAGIPFTLVLV